MTVGALAYINEVLDKAGIRYSFMRFDKAEDTYWIGEYYESESVNEDGMIESDFILTGTTEGSWLELERQKESIIRSFRNSTVILPDGNGLAIEYDNALVIPTDTESIKRIELHLSVKEWRNN